MKYIDRFPHHLGCWIWKGPIGSPGYGKFSIFEGTWGAHRVSYMLFKGPIPEGLHILHSCDNRRCVNPDHLSAGAPKENIQDMIRKGRHRCGRVGGKVGRKLNFKSPNRKLNEQQVKEILQSPLGNYQLAKVYPVSATAIRQLRRNPNHYKEVR